MRSPFRKSRDVAQRVVLALCVLPCLALPAQQAPKQVAVDEQTLQALLTRIDQLEARVKELETKSPPASGALPAPAPESAAMQMETATATVPRGPMPSDQKSHTAPEPEQEQGGDTMMDRMDISKTLLRIRGFGDISVHGDTRKGDTTSFSLGQLDLFLTSDVSDRFRFLSEVVFESGPDNIYGTQKGQANSFGVDLERYLLQYSQSDYFNLSVGRGHTSIGYYNTAYHHSSWLQTATGRPFLFDFEDRGGILPIHMIGVSASGQVPSGSLGLHYVAEIGNGRASREALEQEPVQNEIDDQNRKAYNIELFARPEALRGLQTGFSFYHDALVPTGQPKISESILAAHAVFIRPRYEWLNEAVLDRHAVSGTGAIYNTPGFYTQMSRQWGSYRPYMRYQYLNVANAEPVFSDVGLRHGPSFGLRYDATESVALKFQYDYTMLRKQPAINTLAMQLGFTF